MRFLVPVFAAYWRPVRQISVGKAVKHFNLAMALVMIACSEPQNGNLPLLVPKRLHTVPVGLSGMKEYHWQTEFFSQLTYRNHSQHGDFVQSYKLTSDTGGFVIAYDAPDTFNFISVIKTTSGPKAFYYKSVQFVGTTETNVDSSDLKRVLPFFGEISEHPADSIAVDFSRDIKSLEFFSNIRFFYSTSGKGP